MPLIDRHNADSFSKKEVDVHEFMRMNPPGPWETIATQQIADSIAKEIDKMILDRIMKDGVHTSLKNSQQSLYPHVLNNEPWGILGYMDHPFIPKEDAADT